MVVADQKTGTYQSDAIVLTQQTGVQVKAISSLNPAIFGSASGMNGQHLLVNLSLATNAGSGSWSNPNTVLDNW